MCPPLGYELEDSLVELVRGVIDFDRVKRSHWIGDFGHRRRNTLEPLPLVRFKADELANDHRREPHGKVAHQFDVVAKIADQSIDEGFHPRFEPRYLHRRERSVDEAS